MGVKKFTQFREGSLCCIRFKDIPGVSQKFLIDYSQGFFSFNALGSIRNGTHLTVDFPLLDKTINMNATVIWNKCIEKHRWKIGLSFDK